MDAIRRQLLRYLVVVIIAMFGAPADAAFAEVIVRERTKYYSVTGSSGVELARAMLREAAGPINQRHAIAATEAGYSIGDSKIAVRNGRCVVDDVTVVLDLTYYIPRWTNMNRASNSLRARWNEFQKELLRHEHRHGQIAREGARELEKTLFSISGTVAFNCNDFGAFTTIRLNLLSSRIRQRQLAFDLRENYRTSRISRLQAALIEAR